jgi:imidazolonepropionase-like amidohydrolase
MIKRVALGVLFAASSALAQAPLTRAIVGATVIDGTGSAPIRNAVIVIRDGRIACVGSRAACPVPAGTAVTNAAGKWVIPGIVDAHVHYSQTGWADGRPDALDMRQRFPYDSTIASLKDPNPYYRSYLCSGVTATFDVGGFPWTWSLRSDAERRSDAPHVAAAGPLLSTRDHWLNMPAERQFIYTGSDSATLNGARYLVLNHTDAIKFWFLTGANSPDTTEMSARLNHAGAAAKRAGVPLIAHATGLWQAKHAVGAGVRLLVHSVEDRPVDDEFLAAAKTNGTIYTPTLVVYDGYRQLRLRHFEADKYGSSLSCVDPRTRAKAFLTDSISSRPDTAAATRRAREDQRYKIMTANLIRVRDAGIPIAMGTDAGNPLTLHGASVYLEMEAMAAAGMTPMEVIVAATRTSADAMRRLNDFGTLERGKLADLVVLDADPLADIHNMRRVRQVMRGGVLHERSALEYR